MTIIHSFLRLFPYYQLIKVHNKNWVQKFLILGKGADFLFQLLLVSPS